MRVIAEYDHGPTEEMDSAIFAILVGQECDTGCWVDEPRTRDISAEILDRDLAIELTNQLAQINGVRAFTQE